MTYNVLMGTLLTHSLYAQMHITSRNFGDVDISVHSKFGDLSPPRSTPVSVTAVARGLVGGVA